MTHRMSKVHRRVVASPAERAVMDAEDEKKKAIELVEENGIIPPNVFWDDANNAFTEINTSIAQANGILANKVQEALSTPEKRARIKNQDEVAEILNIVSRDIKAATDTTVLIQSKHAGKTGAATTSAELIEVMEINDQYRAALGLYHDNVMPMIAKLLDLLGLEDETAEETLQQQAQLADNRENLVIHHNNDDTDPNVITDAVIKEIKPNPPESGT
jgi:hypothetical protein